ncbi:hypothetical protein VE03_05212 [Pseudogymnoascus sp. 23342-1-I1]|nr:hypothetical protein VE03_05212 [Pseudogymnoascus sp. 23342-1-I1]
MWGGTTTRSRLQQSITSLHKANNVPEAPTENPVPMIHSTRHLSFSLEKEIAKSLAFISVTSDDNRKVMAVCVEEHIDGDGITIRIASNTGDLSAVTAGFRRIGKILEQVAREPKPRRIDDVETLFREVIALDIDRILSRLRSRHVSKRTIGKPAIITQLHDAIHHESIKSTASIINKSQSLRDLFTELEGIPDIKASTADAQRLVYEIVTQVHALTSSTDLHLLFRDSKLEPPSLKAHLTLAFSKLSRYYSDAYSLVCAARDKECHVFRTVVVEPFHIDMPPFIDETIKVHAEIQLLFFYEVHTHLPRPRIICASKSACYLCNLFFSLHGGFYVPRSHGKLYKSWTLPDWLPVPPARHIELGNLATKFNAALERRIKRPTRRHADPNES